MKEKYTALGVMSGTSLDGLDLALCEFALKNGHWTFRLVDSEFIAYGESLVRELSSAYRASARRLVEIDAEFGKYIGEMVKTFLQKRAVDIDLISSHGQTIFHAPEKGYTCQIGSGAHIAAITNCITVNDFRSMDVAKGGQGAPLVPIGDKLLFGEYDACLNIGGFANLSFQLAEQRMAYDICPANIVLNKVSRQLGSPYDKDGAFAQMGQPIPELFDQLEQNPFYESSSPKSLGIEWVEANVFPLLKAAYEPLELMATFTLHVSSRIAAELDKLEGESVLVTGGGAKNKYLMELLKEKCAKTLILPPNQIIDMKEAIIFAFLGILRLRGDANCLASVTGAGSNTVGGVVHIP